LSILDKAKECGFKPIFIIFDTWYASVKNNKAIREKQWYFLTILKSNFLVNPDNMRNMLLVIVGFEIVEFLKKELWFI
jgi:hypothetical protein